MIASRLLEEKGRGLLESTQLEEVKAKDVFNARNVLPESRYRKLISISTVALGRSANSSIAGSTTLAR